MFEARRRLVNAQENMTDADAHEFYENPENLVPAGPGRRRAGAAHPGRTRRELALLAIEEAVDDLLEDDRELDEELPQGQIEEAVARWEVTIAEMALYFEELLRRRIPGGAEPYHATQAAHKVHSEHMQAEAARIMKESEPG